MERTIGKKRKKNICSLCEEEKRELDYCRECGKQYCSDCCSDCSNSECEEKMTFCYNCTTECEFCDEKIGLCCSIQCNYCGLEGCSRECMTECQFCMYWVCPTCMADDIICNGCKERKCSKCGAEFEDELKQCESCEEHFCSDCKCKECNQ
jgi:hypothetical protein